MGLVDWHCSSCTYYHKSPGNRCVMCGNLRGASKQEMRDFIQGKTLKEKKKEQASGDVSNPGTTQAAKQSAQIQMDLDNSIEVDNAAETGVAKLPPTNPYAAQTRRCEQQHAQQQNKTHPMAITPGLRPQPLNQQLVEAPKKTIAQNTQCEMPPRITTNHGSSINNFFQPDPNTRKNTQQNNTRSANNMDPSRTSSSISAKSKEINQDNNPFNRKKRPQPAYSPGPIPLDPKSSSEWIYPIHEKYPIRAYQFEITKTAISFNTLVSLPTGLGKTLIAAVVLYNFYRWFPEGKVVFLAPTLPLVDQQVRACYQVMGIPARDTAVLNGKVTASHRTELWKERRVFFCTPQTVQRDIEAGRCRAESIVCLVLDEAHKATGNFAYTKVVEQCESAKASFRILALSATPGAKVEQVQKVIAALQIEKLEARSEDDVSQYRHERHQEIVLVKNRTICREIDDALMRKIIQPLMTRLRSSTNIRQRIGPNDATLTSYCIHRGREYHWQTTQGPDQHKFDGYFAAAQKFIDARSTLHSHGIGSVRTKLLQLQNTPQRGILSTLVKSEDFSNILRQVLQAAGGNGEEEISAQDKLSSNPKLQKLVEILTQHFARAKACGENTTRAIVFSQWRESVNEIVSVLSTCQPTIRPRHFVGQGSASFKNINDSSNIKGMPQKVQQQVIREFQSGHYNVLVCTCIGEEGLDIGEVDLIVNYDTLRSPIRMIQRVGRTGRKRKGRVICLISEGQEEKDWKRGQANERTLQRALRRPENFQFAVLPSLFPSTPQPLKQTMQVNEMLPLSQVGGHGGAPKKAKSNTPLLESWKLSKEQEEIRLYTFGPIRCFTDDPRRKWLRARRNACVASYAKKLLAGPSRRLLLTMEATTSSGIVASNTENTRRMKRAKRCDIWEDDDYQRSILNKDWEETASERRHINICANKPPSDTHLKDGLSSLQHSHAAATINLERKATPEAETTSNVQATTHMNNRLKPENQLLKSNVTAPSSNFDTLSNKDRETFNVICRVPSNTRASNSSSNKSIYAPARVNPYSKRLSESKCNQDDGPATDEARKPNETRENLSTKVANEENKQNKRCNTESSFTTKCTAHDPIISNYDEDAKTKDQIANLSIPSTEVEPQKTRTALKDITDSSLNIEKSETTMQGHDKCLLQKGSTLKDFEIRNDSTAPPEIIENMSKFCSTKIEFRLPTPPASSSSESESDDDCESDDKMPNKEAAITVEEESRPSFNQVLRLPTPPASSSSESESDEDSESDDKMLIKESAATAEEENRPSIKDHMIPSEVFLKSEKETFVNQANAHSDNEENKATQFRLPTQDSSSDESSDEDCSLQEKSMTNTNEDPTKDEKVCDEADGLIEATHPLKTDDKNKHFVMETIGTNDMVIKQSDRCKDDYVTSKDHATPREEAILSGREECKNGNSFSVTSRRHQEEKPDYLDLSSSNDRLSTTNEERSREDALSNTHLSPSAKVSEKRSKENFATEPTDGTPKPTRPKFEYQMTDDLVDTPSVNGDGMRSSAIANGNSYTHKPCQSNLQYLQNPELLIDTPVDKKETTRSSRSDLEHQLKNDLIDTPSVHYETQQDKTGNKFSTGTTTPHKPVMLGVDHGQDLVDTPDDQNLINRIPNTQVDDVDDIVCLVCHCGDSPKDDPIVFCDGPNNCPGAFHLSCYSLDPSVIDLMDEWQCDLCTMNSKLKSSAKPSCFVCQRHDSTLKKIPGTSDASSWIHPYCMSWSDDTGVSMCQFCSFPGATPCSFPSCSQVAHPHCVREEKAWLTVVDTGKKQSCIYCPKHRNAEYSGFRWIQEENESIPPKCFILPSSRVKRSHKSKRSKTRKAGDGMDESRKKKRLKKVSTSGLAKNLKREGRIINEIESKEARRKRVRAALAKRHQGMLDSTYIDTDAVVDNNRELAGDDDDDENSEIMRIDEEEKLAAETFINDSQLDYTQDILDRIDPSDESQTIHRQVDAENDRAKQFATPIFNRRMVRQQENSSRSDRNNRSSLKGLGNCHFIRSVIEHARQGGDAEDIENAYHETVANMTQESTESNQNIPVELDYASSSDEGDMNGAVIESESVITAEQQAAIEQRRLEALARRKIN